MRGKWWSLCEDHLINPLNFETNPKRKQAQVDAAWMTFANLIKEEVKVFHQKIKGKYHHNTHAFFGSHADNKAFGTIVWTGISSAAAASLFKDRPVEVLGARAMTPDKLKEQKLPAPELGRSRTVDTQYTDGGWFPNTQRSYFIGAPDENGDGTVPHRSGIAPKANCKAFMQVNVGHEPAYKASEGADNLRACRFTLRAIVQIAQAVKTTSLHYQ